MASFEPDVPVKLIPRYIVTRSPTTLESLDAQDTGVDGADGAIVWTVKLNGATVIAGRGASSFAVSWWGPSESADGAWMQTLAAPSEANTPIEMPSMKT